MIYFIEEGSRLGIDFNDRKWNSTILDVNVQVYLKVFRE